MIYDFNKAELSQMAELLGVDVNSLQTRLDLDDDITIIAVFENSIKVRTAKGQQFILNLK